MVALRVVFLGYFLFFLLSFADSWAAKFVPRFPAGARQYKREQSPYAGGNGANELYETKYFAQTLDHFDFQPQSYTIFQQRYLVNDKSWGGANKSAPIFVYTGNEGDIEWFAQNTGFMFDMAPHFKALLVFIEHRYYGKSIPFGGKEVAYSNATTLGYLSSTQALADYATLIIDLKKNLRAEESPVVVFGGSYGGMLAAWFRLKYPHVTIGALASSAPILHFEDIVSQSPYTFNDIVANDFKSESENCYKVIKQSRKKIEDIAGKPNGLEKLEKSFKICKGQISVDGLENWLNGAFVYAAMTDYPIPSNFLEPLPAYPVKKMCEAIDNPKIGDDTMARLYGAMNIYYNYTGTKSCFDLYAQDPHGLAEWGWQACTEMIMFGYTDGDTYCKDTYGVEPRPHWITTEFGGHDIKRALKRFGSNIIFFNGLRDPWSSGGVLESISKTLISIVAPKGAHHVDLRFSTREDPEWLKDIRGKEIRIIEQWLKQYYEDSVNYFN